MLRTRRILDPLRLVFDCAEALQKADSLVAVGGLGPGKLRTLAEKLTMGYHVVDENCGSQLALRLESMWPGRGRAILRESGDEASQHLLESVDGDDSDSSLH